MDQRDLIEALFLLSEKGVWGEVYNISSESVVEMSEIIEMIEKEMKVHFSLEVDPALLRPTDEKVIAGDVTKLKRDTGWKQKIKMEQTVHDMLEYWRKKL